MGSFLDKPKTEKTNASGEGNNLQYGLASMQGWRIEMEDAHCAVLNLPINGFNDWSFFAVFDGHAGYKVSQYCSEHLLEKILSAENYFCETNNNSKCVNNSNLTNNSSTNDSISSSSSNSPSKATTTSQNINSSMNPKNEKIKNAIIKGFLDLDDCIRKLPEFTNGEDKSGSTAIACLISPHNIYLINCGDSRAILSRDNQVVLNTYDHKPINPEERERIQRAGGSVMIQRVNGSLAVSRALGDFEYKMVDGMGPTEQLVSPEPEIYSIERSDKDEFVVLACDGIWDVMSNTDIKDFIRSRLRVTSNLVQISNEVLDTCLYKVCFFFLAFFCLI
jgi:serine/threonine protein phosphatase PrpC